MDDSGPSRPQLPTNSSGSSSGIEILDVPSLPPHKPRHRPGRSRKASKVTKIEEKSDSSDEIVFVASRLADRYTYRSTSPKSKSSRLSAKREISEGVKKIEQDSEKGKAKSELKSENEGSGESKAFRPLVLKQPMNIPKDAPPPPAWLGKTSVLLRLPECVVCHRRFNKTDSGAARWRHISTCFPPLFKPPNPPPDLEILIHQALLDQASHRPSTLLEHHTNSVDSDDLIDLCEGKSTISRRNSTISGLHLTTNVHPPDTRGEVWESEVGGRVRDIVGRSSPPVSTFSNKTSPIPNGRQSPISPVSPIALPGTQPLGQSSLALSYSRSLPEPISRNRDDRSTTLTPTAFDTTLIADTPGEIINVDEDDWGDDAVLTWDGPIKIPDSESEDDVMSISSLGGSSAASIAPEEAGLSGDESWGREAMLEWNYQDDIYPTQDTLSMGSESEEEPLAVTRLKGKEKEMVPRKVKSTEKIEEMPDYVSMELKKLQKIVGGYGFRPSTNKEALIKIAQDCWRSLHSPTEDQTSFDGVDSDDEEVQDVGSDHKDIDNVEVDEEKKVKSKVTGKGKGKGKRKMDEGEEEDKVKGGSRTVVPFQILDQQFYEMIKGDVPLWTRILRYEPIPFEELIAKSISVGIKGIGWKIRLKRFLDLQGITFFSGDPTGSRKRH
ncbi:hypothetical protein TREMEDRAFT_63193 [Tremella mesenterica DSM 1558]|uniref:uncharacterized protein n=1 Tax=Tremella mesenterica (strain ATCC 24925 / CBS 8224 / DSM 1558 / NBRC 9311 / NRRL Y-6157 / RJB 2259-6 / UBC 559-6) TaxID=578456 RepID=UPI0003F49129|nr:uncharacterized protein TREMEDRAFT_63193 [Tremella mesenterica DSM 1558]EIW68731.1 hypothetical protein TREMEDRAFT_63193 [Tremella mesenterica DSM 1558]